MRQFVKFGIVGASGFVVNLVVFTLLQRARADHAAARVRLDLLRRLHDRRRLQLLSSTGYGRSGRRGHAVSRGAQFLSVSVVALVRRASVVCIVSRRSVPPRHTRRGSSRPLAGIFINFFLNKYWTFKHLDSCDRSAYGLGARAGRRRCVLARSALRLHGHPQPDPRSSRAGGKATPRAIARNFARLQFNIHAIRRPTTTARRRTTSSWSCRSCRSSRRRSTRSSASTRSSDGSSRSAFSLATVRDARVLRALALCERARPALAAALLLRGLSRERLLRAHVHAGLRDGLFPHRGAVRGDAIAARRPPAARAAARWRAATALLDARVSRQAGRGCSPSCRWSACLGARARRSAPRPIAVALVLVVVPLLNPLALRSRRRRRTPSGTGRAASRGCTCCRRCAMRSPSLSAFVAKLVAVPHRDRNAARHRCSAPPSFCARHRGVIALPWMRARSKALLWGWLAGGLLYVYVVVTVERVDYYMLPLLPLCALVDRRRDRALRRRRPRRCDRSPPGATRCWH